MGASQSVVSGHHANPEGRHHRLKRVSSNEVLEPCMMCSQHVELGEVAYRCHAGCGGFVLHDACYHLPKKIKHFAHCGHHLTLSDPHQLPAGRRSCNICAVNFDTNSGGGGGRPSSFIYGCKRCRGFYAHPRCCRLPRTMHNNALHKHALTLLPPQPRANGHGGRSCLNAAGKCQNAKRRLDSDAWSYQCNQCDVEVCLECQLPDGRPAAVELKNGCGNVIETLGPVGQQLATATGTVLRALCCACLGAPMAAPTPASNLK